MGAAFVLRIDHTSNYIECHKAVCWQIGAVNTVGSTTTSIKQANVGQVYCVSTGDKRLLCLDLWLPAVTVRSRIMSCLIICVFCPVHFVAPREYY